MVHRYFAGALGLLIFVIAIYLFRKDNQGQRHIAAGVILAFALLFQAALGMWTVTLQLKPLIVMQVSDLRQWYRDWYSPNNATLVVVGDVEAQDVFTLAEKYYGVIPQREVATLKPRIEPKQVGERRVEVKAVAKLPYIILGYKVPSLNTIEDKREAYALNVLAGILDGGRSSRLSKNLVRGQEIAASAGAGYSLYSARNNMSTYDSRCWIRLRC